VYVTRSAKILSRKVMLSGNAFHFPQGNTTRKYSLPVFFILPVFIQGFAIALLP